MSQMCQIYVILLTVVSGIEMYNQTDYILISERWEVINCNPNYANITVRNFKFNRTHTALNSTYNFKRDYGNDLLMELQAYKFQSNEYRLFPLIFTQNICEMINKNDFGMQKIYKCGNAPRCPFKKGRYLICNWGPDYAKFPPYMPVGRYRLDLKLVYLSEEVAHVQWYLEVKSAK